MFAIGLLYEPPLSAYFTDSKTTSTGTNTKHALFFFRCNHITHYLQSENCYKCKENFYFENTYTLKSNENCMLFLKLEFLWQNKDK